MVEYTCDICQKKWNNKTDFTRHQNRKNPCKVNKYNLLLQKINELEKKMHEIEKENIDLKKNKSSVINNIHKIDKIDNNTINITITPIAFGKEDLSFITTNSSKKILNKGFKSIPELIKMIHFNQDKPEYHNIYLPNWRDKSNILVFDGSKWNLENKDDILDDLKDKGIDYIQTKYEELDENDKKDALLIKKIKRFLESYDEEEKNDILKKDLLLILYNNRELIEKTRKITNKTLTLK
jgi:hypothetical protein